MLGTRHAFASPKQFRVVTWFGVFNSASMKAALILLVTGLALADGAQGELRLPNPPRQSDVWQPPADVPTNLLSAAATLFEQGFPDPRGCEYSEIEVVVSGIWGGEKRGGKPTVKTFGWVLPSRARDTNRFAICWNGLIYPATVLAPADFCRSLTKSSGVTRYFLRQDYGGSESQTVTFSGALSTRTPLLLRCGETGLAMTNWLAGPQEMRSGRGSNESNDPYLQMAGDWAWALFDRTISAHTRGDDALALATAQTLAAVQPKIEAEAARRGSKRLQYYDSVRQGKEQPHLNFLEQLPVLLADLERRAKEGPRVSALERGLTNFAEPSQRIAALIRDLDLVEARQWGQPGGVNTGDDPIVAALIAEGDDAVEPLLDCLEKDKRLTRSVSFGRNFFRGRNVLPVSGAAQTALQAILHAQFRGGAPEIRGHWKKFKGMKLEDRWYATLRDDSEGMSRWLEAAGNITQPENIHSFPGTGFSTRQPVPTNTPVRLGGEMLRSKTNPTVSELMSRRATEVSSDDPATYDVAASCEMGLRLASWDPNAAAPAAKALTTRLRAVLEYSDRRDSWQVQRLGTFLAKLSVVRAEVGDEAAFADYAAWLKATTPKQLESYVAESLEPLGRFPTNPALREAAETLFDNTNGAWGQLPWMGSSFHDPVGSSLINVPAFRKLVGRELERTEICGWVEWRGAGGAGYSLTNKVQSSGSRSFKWPGTNVPAAGFRCELRWCDWIGWSLANVKQIPAFNPFEPAAERDKLIAGAKRSLEAP